MIFGETPSVVICEVLVPEKHKGWGWGVGGGSYGIWGQWYMGPVVYMGEEGLQVEVTWSAMGRLKNSPVDRCYANQCNAPLSYNHCL